MIRALTVIGVACLAGAIALFAAGDGNEPIGIIPLLVAIGISIVLGIRRAYLKVRGVVSDARAFASGRMQTVRIVDVGEPRGIFNPSVNVVLEFEGEDGATHSIDRDLPVPFPVAWSYRLGKRFNVPGLRSVDVAKVLALELKREDMQVTVGRPAVRRDAEKTPA